MSWLNVACVLLALPLAAFVLLSYEDEEKGLNAWIEKSWVTSHDSAVDRTHRLGLLIRNSLSATNRSLSYVYGNRLLSLRAYLVSLALTQAFACILFPLALVLSESDVGWTTLWMPALGLALFSVPYFLRQQPKGAFLILLAYFLVVGPFLWSFSLLYLYIVACAAFLLAPVDLALIVGIRNTLRAAERQRRLSVAIGFIIISLLAIPLLIICFLLVRNFQLMSKAFEGVLNIYLQIGMTLMPIVPAATSLLFLVILSLSLVLKALFELIPRTLYAAIKFEVIQKRKLASTMAVLLVTFAFPVASSYLEKLVKAIGLT